MGVGGGWKVDILILINIILIIIIINLFEEEVELEVEGHITNPSEMVEMEMKTGMAKTEMKRRRKIY